MGNDASTQTLEQGMDLFSNVTDFLGGRIGGNKAASTAGDRAALLETDAAGDAHDLKRRSERDAAKFRGERERTRARGNAGWGGSGLDMSGSKALIRDADRLKDLQAEEDVLFDGERNAESRLRTARSQGNLLRIDEGLAPVRSTLSLGSKIYGRN
ncbi:hypothetical protein [Pseudodesulfovibrio karagichevae]|uniref:Uncharacterized protein n=1 Tax=Pseudodesulfovibrio karagichevae TaxID=3239305 RepID=A0ABV4K6P0_9BACT